MSMTFVGGFAILISWLVYPGVGEQTMFFGMTFGEECGFKKEFGYGCPGCGMTRSWLQAARGNLVGAVTYNAAGTFMFLWLAVGFFIGALRLILKKPKLMRIHPLFVLLGVVVWLVLVLGVFWGRVNGINPLP